METLTPKFIESAQSPEVPNLCKSGWEACKGPGDQVLPRCRLLTLCGFRAPGTLGLEPSQSKCMEGTEASAQEQAGRAPLQGDVRYSEARQRARKAIVSSTSVPLQLSSDVLVSGDVSPQHVPVSPSTAYLFTFPKATAN